MAQAISDRPLPTAMATASKIHCQTAMLLSVEPKKNKVKHFLSKYNYDKNIKNYIMSNIDTKSIDLAYNIKDDKIVRTAFYDVF